MIYLILIDLYLLYINDKALIIIFIVLHLLWDNGLIEACMCHQSHLTSNHIGAIKPSTNIYLIPQK